MARALLVATLVVGLAHPVVAQLVPLGGQVQVNSYTTGLQGGTSVGVDADGNFVVAWTSFAGDSDLDSSVQAQRYDASGAPLGSQFQVNAYTTLFQTNPRVAVAPTGDFVVTWESYGSAGSDIDGLSMQAQRYDSSGAPAGSQFQVNTYTTFNQFRPAVAIDGGGTFVIAWQSYGGVGNDTAFGSVQAQRFDSSGAPLGGQFQVNTFTPNVQKEVAVGADAAGNFVVVWTSFGSFGSDNANSSVQGQLFNPAGAPIGGQFQVNTYTTGSQSYPTVGVSPGGGFVVTWSGSGSSGSDTGVNFSVQARRYDAAGAPIGDDFQVNTWTTSFQFNSRVGMDPAGNFVVAWTADVGDGTDTSAASIQARRYDAAGAPLGAEFQVNSYTTGNQYDASVGLDAAGNFVVAWLSDGSAGTDQDGGSIQAQRYAPARTILGKKMLVTDPTGNEAQRGVVAFGKETATDVGPAIVGDPTVTGATLRIITAGSVDSDQSYALDAAGWTALGTVGYRYVGPTGGDADPVRKAILKRTPGGKALVKVLLRGSSGAQSLDVVPPNGADEGGLILSVNGGGTYCVAFRGVAGGTELGDSTRLWNIINATAEACPTP